MKKFFIVYGHYDDKSFNAAIKNTFIDGALEAGHKVDLLDLYKENFNPIFAGEEPGPEILDHRQRIEDCDVIVFIAPIWNFRMPAILEGWIDRVLAPPWAFSFKQLIGNYGYPEGNLSNKKAIIFCTYSSPRLAVTTFFLNLPIRRLKRGVFHICGIRNILYKRYFAVPFVEEKRRKKFLEDAYRTAKYFK
jgi:NAD(P)H dehydrogenase (quinone)